VENAILIPYYGLESERVSRFRCLLTPENTESPEKSLFYEEYYEENDSFYFDLRPVPKTSKKIAIA
jgi:hypothetical protein